MLQSVSYFLSAMRSHCCCDPRVTRYCFDHHAIDEHERHAADEHDNCMELEFFALSQRHCVRMESHNLYPIAIDDQCHSNNLPIDNFVVDRSRSADLGLHRNDEGVGHRSMDLLSI